MTEETPEEQILNSFKTEFSKNAGMESCEIYVLGKKKGTITAGAK